ncbi:MAG: 30S ribosomal protein S20 [Candidatus Sungbacteria bacterium]|nr:30S ribosomal protein S20 [Candidatus Sungbacteria bacterium]
MPITQSAKKALRQSVRRRSQNTLKRDAFRALQHEIRNLVAAKKKEDAKKLLPKLYKALDKAAKTNAITANKASRMKSRTTKFIQAA